MTEYSDTSGPADSPGDAGVDPGAANGVDAGALAVEDQLPARQEPDAAEGDDPEYDYDEDDLATGYDGDLEALTAEDRFPAGQESGSSAEGDDPEDDEADLTAEDDGSAGALAVEDQLPARQEPDAALDDDSEYDYDEDDLAVEYDGDLEALTAEDQITGTSDPPTVNGATGDQDQAAAGETPPATEKPDDPPVEALGATSAPAPEHEDGNATASEPSSDGAPADTGTATEANGAAPDQSAEIQQAEVPAWMDAYLAKWSPP